MVFFHKISGKNVRKAMIKTGSQILYLFGRAYLNLNVLLTTFGGFDLRLPRLFPLVTLFVGVPLRLREVVSVLLVLVRLITSS